MLVTGINDSTAIYYSLVELVCKQGVVFILGSDSDRGGEGEAVMPLTSFPHI